MGYVALMSALWRMFPAHLAQPAFVRDSKSLCISCDLWIRVHAQSSPQGAACCLSSSLEGHPEVQCQLKKNTKFLGTAHNHPISFPACNSQKRCELCLDDILCLHLSGTSEFHLTVKAKRGRCRYRCHRVCSLLAFFGSPVGCGAAKRSSGRGRQMSECTEDCWGRSVQVTLRATRDAKDRKAQMCGGEEMREDRVLGMRQAVKDVKWGVYSRKLSAEVFWKGSGGRPRPTDVAVRCMAFFPCIAQRLRLGSKTARPFKGLSGIRDNLRDSDKQMHSEKAAHTHRLGGWTAWPPCGMQCRGVGGQGEGENIPSCPVWKFILGIKMQCFWQSRAPFDDLRSPSEPFFSTLGIYTAVQHIIWGHLVHTNEASPASLPNLDMGLLSHVPLSVPSAKAHVWWGTCLSHVHAFTLLMSVHWFSWPGSALELVLLTISKTPAGFKKSRSGWKNL